MHESLDEFKFRPDTDTNTRVICPCASEKLLYNVVSTLAPSFLIGSSSYLQVLWIRKFSRDFYFVIFSFSNYSRVHFLGLKNRHSSYFMRKTNRCNA